MKTIFCWTGFGMCLVLAGMLWSYMRYENLTVSEQYTDNVITQLAALEQLSTSLQQMGSGNVDGAKLQLSQKLSDQILTIDEMLKEANEPTRDLALSALDRIARFYKAHPH